MVNKKGRREVNLGREKGGVVDSLIIGKRCKKKKFNIPRKNEVRPPMHPLKIIEFFQQCAKNCKFSKTMKQLNSSNSCISSR